MTTPFDMHDTEYQIVGVFHNVRGAGLRPAYPEVIVPFWQNPGRVRRSQ